jgi:hypothetical protein
MEVALWSFSTSKHSISAATPSVRECRGAKRIVTKDLSHAHVECTIKHKHNTFAINASPSASHCKGTEDPPVEQS